MSAPVMFQALPPLSPEEYSDLEKSILENGVMVPIVLDEHGVVIDGHHRQQIASHHGLPCPSETKSGFSDTEKRGLALSLNLHRRHLTREQKRALVAESIKADPQLSDREHGRRTGVSKNTASAIRGTLEESGQVDHFPERLDPRTGNASQSATKPRTQTGIECSVCEGTFDPSVITELDGEPPLCPSCLDVHDGEKNTVAPGFTADQLAELNIDPREMSNYAAMASLSDDEFEEEVLVEAREDGDLSQDAVADRARARSSAPRRKAITDQARDAGWELRKAVERIERIAADDRFSAQIEKMTPQLRGHLTDAITSCQAVLDRINNP